MSETLSGLKLLVITILLLSFCMLSGCMGRSGMVMLKKDVLYQDEGFETVVLWRLKVIDRTGDFKNFYPVFRATDPRDLFNKLINKSDKWTEKNGVAYYDGTFMTQSRPGTCTFLNIRLPLGSTTSGGVYTKLRKTSTYFDIDLRKSWIVPKGKVLYLGDFVVHIESKKLVQGRGYVYTYNVYNSKNQQGLDSISHTFRDRYPELSGHFKNGAEFAAPLLLNETFHSLSYKNGWAKRQNDKKYDAYIDEGQYLVDTKTATCAVFGIRRLFKLPGKYDIELTSTWKAGMVNRFYGLVLGIDLNNLYRFGVAANGAANASLIMNGALQTNPLGLTAGATFRNNGTNTNVHKIKVRGNTISYYVNDTLIGKTQSRLKFNKWFVGVTVCDKQKVAFDNLRISQQW